MMECKKALVEADGDLDRARDILRVRGQAGAAKRSGRAATDGVVATALGEHGMALVELNSETDFVARNDAFRQLARDLATAAAQHGAGTTEEVLRTPFGDGRAARQHLDDLVSKLRENILFRRVALYEKGQQSVLASYVHTVTHKIGAMVELEGDPESEAQQALARNIAMHIAAVKPEYLRREDVPAADVERERAVLTERTRAEGKPEAALPKIVEGRLGKFYEGVCLVEQPYVREPAHKVGQLLSQAGAQARRFALFVVGQE